MTCLTSIGFGNVAAETDIEKVNNLSVINNETKTRSKQRQPIGMDCLAGWQVTSSLFWPRYGCSDFRGIENLHNIFYLWSHQTLDTFFFEVVEPLHVELAQDQFQAWLEARVDALVVDLVGN